MDSLPNELFRFILSFLSASNLILGERCCKKWKNLANDILEKESIVDCFIVNTMCYKELRISSHKEQKKAFDVRIKIGKYTRHWHKTFNNISTSIHQELGSWEQRDSSFIFPFFVSFLGRITVWFDEEHNIREIHKDVKIYEGRGTRYTFLVQKSDKGTSWISKISICGYHWSEQYPEPDLFFPNGKLPIDLVEMYMPMLTIRNHNKHISAFCLIKPRKNRFMIRKKFLDEYKVPDFGVVPQMMI
jgi:hypothetical protein